MPEKSNTADRRLILRVASFWMVVLAVGLAVIGMVLALQQARAFTMRLMAEAEAQAARIATQARDRLDTELMSALDVLAESAKTSEVLPGRLANLPSWIDLAFLWDGQNLEPLRGRPHAPERLARLIGARLAIRSFTDFGIRGENRPEMLYDTIGNEAVVLGCLDATDRHGQPLTVVVHLHLDRLKSEFVERLTPVGSGLEVVSAAGIAAPWSQTLSGPLRFWAIRPTEQFIREQQSTVLRQTLVYLGLTVIALFTLLGAMWVLLRVTRREMALAEMKANFVADVSHELKTPLALIHMFAETLQSGRVNSDEKRAEYYDIILRESTRLTNLINNILDFARIDAGKKIYNLDSIDAGQVVADTYDAYTAQLDAAKFKHCLTIEPDLPPVRADRDAIAQAVLNLINNAIKYSPDERHLAIDVTRDTRRGRHGVLISVHDRGMGIQPEDRARLTEGFFRVSDGRVRTQGGTGLGLALVKHIVDEHSGTLDIESRLVRGSTFRIFLPAADGASPTDRRPHDRILPRGDGTPTSANTDSAVN